jgi:hypothetical protein
MVTYRPNSETRRLWRDWKSPVKSRALRCDLTPAEHSDWLTQAETRAYLCGGAADSLGNANAYTQRPKTCYRHALAAGDAAEVLTREPECYTRRRPLHYSQRWVAAPMTMN